jgi:hypothetical protein
MGFLSDSVAKLKAIPKETWLKIAGVTGIVAGCVCFFLAGTTSSAVAGLVAGVFALLAIVAALLK